MAAKKQVEAPTAEKRHTKSVRQNNISTKSVLRRELHARGIRYRIHVPVLTKLRRVADVASIDIRVAIFVDSYFWHSHPLRRAKIVANQRVRDTGERLRAEGWEVIRVWAHEKPMVAAERIAHILEHRRARMHRV